MKHIFFFLLLISISLSSIAQMDNSAEIETVKLRHPEYTSGKMLVITCGGLSSRKFGQDLQTALEKKLGKLNVATSFTYLGPDSTYSNEVLKQAAAQYPDAYVLFIQPAFVRDTRYASFGVAEIAGSSLVEIIARRDMYMKRLKRGREQSERLCDYYLSEGNQVENPFWKGSFVTSTNMASERTYKELAEHLVNNWKENKLIEKIK
ncbi:MAG TPA: hypothetical protein VM802_21745 [Chitinophaga sp.]|uniref:hypothetical protein n=1 Tax=Chitinophaga sp. TaxID=1869181 RepID=UPI002B9BB17A|nr:hypothetical protein [Chitinophaga sp.]HVI47511.1 hypothetical protein [Chitinophaga sp.]